MALGTRSGAFFFTLTGLLALGCGGGDGGGGGGPGGTGGTGGSSGSSGAGGSGAAAGAGGSSGSTGQRPPYDVKAAERDGCGFGPGAKTTETVGPDVPHGDALPFEHIVLLMQENRSFDHYFSKLPEYGVTDVKVAADTDYNLDPSTSPPAKVERFHESRYCILDVNHEWNGVHFQYDDGKMSGFVSTNNPGGARAMGYYDQTDLPYYYWLAKNFAISDSHFCSLLGPTWPNRFFFYGATAWGNTKTGDLAFVNVPFLGNDRHTKAEKIMDQLEKAGRTWKIYRDGSYSFAVVFKQSAAYLGSSMSQFETDVDNDALPAVSILDPAFGGAEQNDEHPPANIQKGQQLVERVLGKLMSKPEVWKKTVFFLFYDEHGGYYDSVPPPPACEPDNWVPQDWKFDRLGFRTPLIVASPFVKPGYVSHLVTDLTSITRFIQNRFDLPAMTVRDANAWPMLDMFDFDGAPLSTPPSGAPSGAPDPAGLQWCANNTPGTGMP
ncbi:MAG: alkaline phosphatase family protein [Polyangiaceae bacterium]